MGHWFPAGFCVGLALCLTLGVYTVVNSAVAQANLPSAAAKTAPSAPGTSSITRCRPSRTRSWPPTTTFRTSAADAANTTEASAVVRVAPASLGESSATVTRSAIAPAAISPASGQPRLACPSVPMG